MKINSSTLVAAAALLISNSLLAQQAGYVPSWGATRSYTEPAPAFGLSGRLPPSAGKDAEGSSLDARYRNTPPLPELEVAPPPPPPPVYTPPPQPVYTPPPATYTPPPPAYTPPPAPYTPPPPAPDAVQPPPPVYTPPPPPPQPVY
ncbi:MAG: hypothetical protein LBV54_02170, partial [Puniceicoccales bacterium]|nr:hypothetical protein [Puniceicoccales bacterium]